MKEKNIDGKKLNNKALRRCLVSIIISFICVILSIYLNKRVSKLSFINTSDYLKLLIISIYVLLVISIVLFVNSIRNKELKNACFEIIDNLRFLYNTIIILSFFVLFITSPAQVVGESMMNTYSDGDKILVWHLGYKPKKSDVVIIDVSSDNYDQFDCEFIIKRVIATPGDIVFYNTSSQELSVNGKVVDNVSSSKAYNMLYDRKTSTAYFKEDENIIIPDGLYICRGDNRLNSTDSTSTRIGLVHKEDILGKSIFRIYPFKNIGIPKENHLS